MLRTLDLPRAVAAWLALAALATALCAIVELAAQQSLRLTGDDPQIQLAEDAARSRSAADAAVAAGAAVDIARSLAPWIALYDAAGRPLASTGRLDGAAPRLPAGVFAFVRAHGEDRVTWQPRPGVRSAVVVTLLPSGEFAVAGRSLREIERREGALVRNVLVAWMVTVCLCAVCVVALRGNPGLRPA